MVLPLKYRTPVAPANLPVLAFGSMNPMAVYRFILALS
jgi:hypothetical protein